MPNSQNPEPQLKTATHTDSKPSVHSLWESVLTSLNMTLSELIFKTWIKPIRAENLTETSLDLICPSQLARDKLLTYKSLIQQTVNEVGKGNYELNFVVRELNSQTKNQTSNSLHPITKKARSATKKTDAAPLFDYPEKAEEQTAEKRRQSGLTPNFTFDNFVMGTNNQLAYSVAMAVAQTPGELYNPFFIYSGVGLGKTHLIQAIGNQILKEKPHLKVVYTTSEQFTNELVDTIQAPHASKKAMKKSFREKFRETDVLLIDDIQFLIGRETTKEEFFHTFNALHLGKKQIVLTSDRPPHEFNDLEERITSRFGSGMIVDIQKPDFEMRSAILRRHRDKQGDQVSNEVIDFIATKVDTNIRELEGAYIRVTTYAKNDDRPLTVETAAEALGQLIPQRKELANPNEILNAVCKYFSITKAEIKGRRRTKNIVIPRQIAMYLLKDLTGIPLVAIGDLLGGRDHTTIMHGADKIEEEIREEARMEQDVRNIKQLLYMD